MSQAADNEQSPSRAGKRIRLIAACVLIVAGVVVGANMLRSKPTIDDLVEAAETALSESNYPEAERLAGEALRQSPDSTAAQLLRGRALFQLGRCAESEEALRRVLEQDADNVDAHQTLVLLLKMDGRYHELRPHALSLLKSGDSGNEFLIPLAAADRTIPGSQEFELAQRCSGAARPESATTLAAARYFLQFAELERAEAVLREVLSAAPQNIEAQAVLGSVILQLGDAAAFDRWHRELPEAAEQHPEIWFLRGRFAAGREDSLAAIRCFGEAVARDPNHRQANYHLSQLFSAQGKTDTAAIFTARFEQLEEVSRLATRGDDSSAGDINAATMQRIGVLMDQLGRLWEAAAWLRKAIEFSPEPPGARNMLRKIEGRLKRLLDLNKGTPLTLPASNPVGKIDLAAYPLPEWRPIDSGPQPGPLSPANESWISFADMAGSLGLEFQFENGAHPRAKIARMYEFSGGGAAVLDYDSDGWPDIYLTQGSVWPLGYGGFRDRLFRNVNGERFEDVTDEAGLGDESYSQGAAVGDFDNDGYPDILLANIGANRLYRNNGDGTFTDVAGPTGTRGNDWTLSCLLADVNGDSLPDLYCVNYLGGGDIFTRVCQHSGRPTQCPLHYFPSAPDRLYLSRGDGSFEDVSHSSGVALPEGKGMGIVAADFDRTGRLSLFIANDDKPNFLLVNDADAGRPIQAAADDATARKGRSTEDIGAAQPLSFRDDGIASGLAFGDQGAAQSSMGVAAGDADNDGLLELFVTNFSGEHSNFYVQKSPGLFQDAARPAGLYLPTLKHMGWGAQFLDADLDGLPDLLVANGHLDKNTAGDGPYKMPTQFFRNLGKLRFAELPGDSLGRYFSRNYAGRAVARLDWNRDGADDACITHVEKPVALLSNTTAQRGHFLGIHLRGVRSSRDAIGSVVRVEGGGQTWYRHLTAGDGFQASNERKLTFGLGECESIDDITIHWPSGLEQVLSGIFVDRELLVVEGQPAIELSGSGSNSHETK